MTASEKARERYHEAVESTAKVLETSEHVVDASLKLGSAVAAIIAIKWILDTILNEDLMKWVNGLLSKQNGQAPNVENILKASAAVSLSNPAGFAYTMEQAPLIQLAALQVIAVPWLAIPIAMMFLKKPGTTNLSLAEQYDAQLRTMSLLLFEHRMVLAALEAQLLATNIEPEERTRLEGLLTKERLTMVRLQEQYDSIQKAKTDPDYAAQQAREQLKWGIAIVVGITVTAMMIYAGDTLIDAGVAILRQMMLPLPAL